MNFLKRHKCKHCNIAVSTKTLKDGTKVNKTMHAKCFKYYMEFACHYRTFIRNDKELYKLFKENLKNEKYRYKKIPLNKDLFFEFIDNIYIDIDDIE